MLFADFSYQYFDWWHDIIPDANEFDVNGERFEHSGLFKNKIINLGATVGINDYWNITISQFFLERCMEWGGPVDEFGNSLTVHHRTECSSTDFFNDEGTQMAYGGTSGDARINFRYLLFNQGKGPGNRLFFGIGLDIPSSNVITESPWKKTDGEYTPHRHFYISDGAYKLNLDLQFFNKRTKFPVFWGGVFTTSLPLNDSKYGFSPSNRYQLNILALSGSNSLQKIKLGEYALSSIGLTLFVDYATRSSWDNEGDTPNSKSLLYMPGINFLISTPSGNGLGINIARGYQYYFNENASDVDEDTDIFSITVNYRTVLDKIIEKLY